jgi:hypothetical protein
MPIKPPVPLALYGDLARARQIARSWKPLNQLSPEDIEIVARAIAEGIAEGRRHGLQIAEPHLEA